MQKVTSKQSASNAPSVIAFSPGMTRCGNMSVLIIKPESYNTPGRFKLVPIVAHDGQDATDSLPAARASSEVFDVLIPKTHEVGH
jgi:hypothetical protein